MVSNSPVIIFAIGIPALIIIVLLIWYLRFRQNKVVSDRARRTIDSYIGRERAAGIYQIRIPGANSVYIGFETPPPTFSKAVKFPKPEDDAPPSYAQSLLLLDAQRLQFQIPNRRPALAPATTFQVQNEKV